MSNVQIAANRNSALATEKNDILNFLSSYFLSIGVICNLPVQRRRKAPTAETGL